MNISELLTRLENGETDPKTAEAEIMTRGDISVSNIAKADAQIAASDRVLVTHISEEHRAPLLKTSNPTSVVHDGTSAPVTGRLQSCSVLPVVNIGAGFVAGAFTARIPNNASAAGKGKTQTIGKGGISL